ncbi:unnamed protein product [Amoebophrya sp. A120]|nr:unnamed protein product [Amoebophrya sp. A120]|eukprot:GSA120T00022360001.1
MSCVHCLHVFVFVTNGFLFACTRCMTSFSKNGNKFEFSTSGGRRDGRTKWTNLDFSCLFSFIRINYDECRTKNTTRIYFRQRPVQVRYRKIRFPGESEI